jgi:hypothetical protein
MTVRIRRADHSTPLYQQNFALTSPIIGGRSFDIGRLGIKAMEFALLF